MFSGRVRYVSRCSSCSCDCHISVYLSCCHINNIKKCVMITKWSSRAFSALCHFCWITHRHTRRPMPWHTHGRGAKRVAIFAEMVQPDWQWTSIFVTGVTILLSQTVFSLLVGHVITKTSEAIPLIGESSSSAPLLVMAKLYLNCLSSKKRLKNKTKNTTFMVGRLGSDNAFWHKNHRNITIYCLNKKEWSANHLWPLSGRVTGDDSTGKAIQAEHPCSYLFFC